LPELKKERREKKRWVKGMEGESRKKRYDKKVDYKFPCLLKRKYLQKGY